MFEYETNNTTHDDDESLRRKHSFVWKQPLESRRNPDTDYTTDGCTGHHSNVKEAHGGLTSDVDQQERPSRP